MKTYGSLQFVKKLETQKTTGKIYKVQRLRIAFVKMKTEMIKTNVMEIKTRFFQPSFNAAVTKMRGSYAMVVKLAKNEPCVTTPNENRAAEFWQDSGKIPAAFRQSSGKIPEKFQQEIKEVIEQYRQESGEEASDAAIRVRNVEEEKPIDKVLSQGKARTVCVDSRASAESGSRFPKPVIAFKEGGAEELGDESESEKETEMSNEKETEMSKEKETEMSEEKETEMSKEKETEMSKEKGKEM